MENRENNFTKKNFALNLNFLKPYKVHKSRTNKNRLYLKNGKSVNKSSNEKLNIAELGLSIRLYNKLIHNEIFTINDLITSIREKSLMKVIDYNSKYYLEIINKLSSKGILKEACC